MENNNLMEGLNEGTVIEVYEGVNKSIGSTVLKVGVGAVVVTALGYGVYKIVKRIKNRKNQTEVVEAEYVETESEK
jgi:hypothetical protein